MILKVSSNARAGFVGNPSDGYFGKTLSFTMEDFAAEVTMWESPRLEFLPCVEDDASFDNIDGLLEELQLYGYYGGIRLLKATTKVFVEYCRESNIELATRNFSVSYRSNIPRLVGLGGSSAICTAMFRTLMAFYEVDIPKPVVPTLCLQAETDELALQAGLQDRVVQVYNGLTFMDFDQELVEGRGYGRYEAVDPALLPPVYIAFDPQRAEVSGRYHRKLRVLFERHDEKMTDAMHQFADLAQAAYDAIVGGQPDRLPALIDANFDLRDSIFNVSEANRHIVMTARKTGASAKLAGSGGAIVGAYEDTAMFGRLKTQLAAIGCSVIKPRIPEMASD